MANAQYGQVIYVNAVGIVSKTPLDIVAIQHYPAAVSNSIDLNFWDEANPVSEVTFNASIATGVVTETDDTIHTLSSANFPATDVVKIMDNSSCVAANKTYHLIGAGGDNHAITVDPVTTLTDETEKDYHTIVYPQRPFFNCLQSTATNTHESKWYYFGDIRVPNLVCEAIASNSSVLIYVK